MRWFPRFARGRTPALSVAMDVGQGPIVVLVHGIASSPSTFQNVVPLLADAHRLIAVDLLGFGASPSPADARFTMDEHVDALERTLRARGVEHCILVGHSLGALIAARYAATHRSVVTGLVLVSPPIYLPPDAFGDPVARAAMRGYLRAFEFLRHNREFTIRNASVLARLAPIRGVLEIDDRNWTAFASSLQHAIETQSAVSDIASVTVPVHLVYGTLDPFLVPAGLHIVEQMRHVTAHRVNGGDHVIRKRMARIVATAVASLARSSRAEAPDRPRRG